MLAKSLILLVTITCLLSSPIWFLSAFIPNISTFPDSHLSLSWWPCLPSHRENSDINMPSIKFMSITHFIFPTAFLVQNHRMIYIIINRVSSFSIYSKTIFPCTCFLNSKCSHFFQNLLRPVIFSFSYSSAIPYLLSSCLLPAQIC